MDRNTLNQHLQNLLPDLTFIENRQYTEVLVPAEKLHSFCFQIKSTPDLQFDYLISITAVDWKDHFMIVCHCTSTIYRHTIVVKSKIEDHEHPETDTLSDVWKTSEFHEREIYDMFGIKFRNHPDLRRLFMEDDYGFPLRKDFTDESRMIVK